MTTGEKLSLLSGLSYVSAMSHLDTAQVGGGQTMMVPYSDLVMDINSNVLGVNIQDDQFVLTAYPQTVTIDFGDSATNATINQEILGVNNEC